MKRTVISSFEMQDGESGLIVDVPENPGFLPPKIDDLVIRDGQDFRSFENTWMICDYYFPGNFPQRDRFDYQVEVSPEPNRTAIAVICFLMAVVTVCATFLIVREVVDYLFR